MSKLNRLNLEQFMAKAKQKEKNRMKLGVYVSDTFGAIDLKYMGLNAFMEIFDGVEKMPLRKQMEVNNELVYQSMPILHEQVLLEEMGCVDDPISVVSKVFGLDEISKIVEHLMKFNGIDVGLTEVKNS